MHSMTPITLHRPCHVNLPIHLEAETVAILRTLEISGICQLCTANYVGNQKETRHCKQRCLRLTASLVSAVVVAVDGLITHRVRSDGLCRQCTTQRRTDKMMDDVFGTSRRTAGICVALAGHIARSRTPGSIELRDEGNDGAQRCSDAVCYATSASIRSSHRHSSSQTDFVSRRTFPSHI